MVPGRELIRGCEPTHREFDVAAGKLPPAFDRTHIGRLGIAVEEVTRPHPRLVARQGKGLAQVAVVGLARAGHPAREIAGTKAQLLTPEAVTPDKTTG